MPLLQLCYVHIMQFRIRHSTGVHLADVPLWHQALCTVYCWVSFSGFANKVLITVKSMCLCLLVHKLHFKKSSNIFEEPKFFKFE